MRPTSTRSPRGKRSTRHRDSSLVVGRGKPTSVNLHVGCKSCESLRLFIARRSPGLVLSGWTIHHLYRDSFYVLFPTRLCVHA